VTSDGAAELLETAPHLKKASAKLRAKQ